MLLFSTLFIQSLYLESLYNVTLVGHINNLIVLLTFFVIFEKIIEKFRLKGVFLSLVCFWTFSVYFIAQTYYYKYFGVVFNLNAIKYSHQILSLTDLIIKLTSGVELSFWLLNIVITIVTILLAKKMINSSKNS